jgi:hypothetical protein
MIARVGLRLALAAGRHALLRLAFTAIGVWVGLTLMLLALTAVAAAHGRDVRQSWLDAAYAFSPDDQSLIRPPAESADGALFLAVTDYHDGARMTRAYVAALGDDPPVPPGLDRLPGPGEVAVSPAMRRLLESTPDDELDERFPGEVTLTIGPAGLAHENQLVALIGRTPDQLEGVQSVSEVRGFHVSSGGLPAWIGPAGILEVLLLFGAGLLLGPVVVVIFMVTRVGWAQREQRIAAIRLVGAARLQAAVITGVETGLAAAVGTALAWASYEVGRRIAAESLVFQGGHFWWDDVAIPTWLLALILAGTPVLVMLAPLVSQVWASGNPLVTSRLGRRPAPNIRHALPLAAAVAGTLLAGPLEDELGALSGMFGLATLGCYVVGFVLIGPWLCMVVGRGIARLSRGVSGLIASHRIAADPYAAFRAVSIVVLAVSTLTFLGSVGGRLDPPDEPSYVRLKPGVVMIHTGGVPESKVAPLLSPQAVVVRARAEFGPAEVSCAELSRVRYLSCPASDAGFNAPEPDFATLPILQIYIPTDGSPAAESRIRNQAADLVPNAIINSDRHPEGFDDITSFPELGDMVTIASLFVLLLAAIGLTAGMVGSLLERRRPFALLRASGVRLGELRRVMFLEVAATMVLTSVAGVGIGMLLAYTATRRAGLLWVWPEPEVYAYAGGAVLAALLLSTLALPLLDAATRFDAIRYE